MSFECKDLMVSNLSEEIGIVRAGNVRLCDCCSGDTRCTCPVVTAGLTQLTSYQEDDNWFCAVC